MTQPETDRPFGDRHGPTPDEVAAAIATCPGYEASPNLCRCPCYGCKHHCSAHQPETPAAAGVVVPQPEPGCALPGFMGCDCDHVTGCQQPKAEERHGLGPADGQQKMRLLAKLRAGLTPIPEEPDTERRERWAAAIQRKVVPRITLTSILPEVYDASDAAMGVADEEQRELIARLGQYADRAIANGQEADRLRAELELARADAEVHRQRNIRALEAGIGDIPEQGAVPPTEDEQAEPQALQFLFWDEPAGVVREDGRITAWLSTAASVAEFVPAGQLILRTDAAARLRRALTTALNDEAETQAATAPEEPTP